MLTPQEIQDKKFEKAVFCGYDMGGVDRFLESLNSDYAALYKENAMLKNKLKVLVDKIEEYRSVDDVMRQMALKAQKESQEIIDKAQKQAQEILTSTHVSITDKKRDMRREMEREETRLNSVKQETIKFVNHLRELYTKEIELLAAIPSLPVEESKKSARDESVATAAKEIEDSVQIEIAKEAERIAAETEKDAPPPPLPKDAKVYEVKFGDRQDDDMDDIWKPEEDTVIPKPRTSFDDLELEFGPNYKG